jgi:hypothetical protein
MRSFIYVSPPVIRQAEEEGALPAWNCLAPSTIKAPLAVQQHVFCIKLACKREYQYAYQYGVVNKYICIPLHSL